ncbi:MAG: hypothetical protein B7733_25900 [Myxococcales bacterium FL481]|nr:MAG: hypothetical protein B7733_25900 [Myxococcales bacterium FL481]
MPRARIAGLCAAAAFSCSQQSPPPDAHGDGDGYPPGEADSLYPLIPGSSYTYRHVTGEGAVTGLEFVNVHATNHAGEHAVLLADEPDAAGQSTHSLIVRRGSAALRVHKDVHTHGVVDVSVDYSPGFLRMDDAWAASPGGQFVRSYLRTATEATGGSPVAENRSHRWQVVAVDEAVSVNAGEFLAVHVQRTRMDEHSQTGESVDLWFAAGVGKIRERRQSPTEGIREELLDDYRIGEI